MKTYKHAILFLAATQTDGCAYLHVLDDMGMCVREHCQQMCNYVSLLPTWAVHSTTPPQSQNALGQSFTL